MIHTVYIGIGSNLGDRMQHILDALKQLSDKCGITLTQSSPIYESEALGLDELASEEPPYLNAVARIDTVLDPEALLCILQSIEITFSRPANRAKNAPRTIDLDMLLYNDLVLNSATLTIPHPKMAKRMFVLAPMSDIAPELREPATSRTIAEMKADLGTGGGQVTRVT
jgi:2-amino-4-hydroxy-6-hydroxymethyldihydropteridine diphosphokinase